MPQFDVSTFLPQIFWLVVSFGLLVLGLKFWIIPKFEDVFEKRHHQIDGQIKKAEILRLEIEKFKEETKHRLSEGEERGRDIMASALKEIELTIGQKESEFQKSMDLYIEEAQKRAVASEKDITNHMGEIQIKVMKSLFLLLSKKIPDEETLKKALEKSQEAFPDD